MSCCTTKTPPWPCGFSVWERSSHAWPVVFGSRIGSATLRRLWHELRVWCRVLSAAKSPTSHDLGGARPAHWTNCLAQKLLSFYVAQSGWQPRPLLAAEDVVGRLADAVLRLLVLGKGLPPLS